MAKQKQGISRNKLLGLAGTGWMFDAMDVGILSFVIAALAVEWQLTPSQMGWIGSVNSIGMAVGALGFGMLADRMGRKNVFMMTLVLFYRKRLIRVYNDANCFSSPPFFCRCRTWRRAASRINIGI